ncbi:MAG: type III secretion system translocon subunit SctE, partial [Endozoicomonas sp.]
PKNTNGNNGLAKMHSFSARLNGIVNGDDALSKTYDLFSDVFNKVANITSIPENLQKDLQKNLQAFTSRFVGEERILDVDQATMMLMKIQTQLQDNRIKFDQENIKINQVVKEQASNKRLTQLLAALDKVKEAKKAGLIGRIFGFIGVAVMAIVAIQMVVLAAFTGGATAVIAAALMVAAVGLVITMTVSNETGGWMNKVFGEDADSQRNAMIMWTCIVVVLSIGAAVAGGAGGGAGAGASTASTATSTASSATVTATAANAAATAASSSAKIAAISAKIAKALQLASAASMVGSGAAEAVNTTYTYEADMLRADAKKLQAKMLFLQQMIEDNIESIQRAIDELQHGYQTITAIMKDNHDTKVTLSRNMRA